MLYKLYDPQHQGIMGPRYEHLFRNAALTVMADPEGGTFVDIPKLFRDPQYVKQKLQYVKDPNVLEFWQKEMPASQRSNEFGDVVSWFVSKFGAFLSNEMMRNIIGQNKSAFDMRDIMDNKKILLVNLSKGKLGELNSKLLGIVFVMKFQAAAMSRSDIPEDDRVDFSLYVDEFRNFSTDSFATIMSEARKYHLNLIVANQFTTQLTQEIRDAVFGNIGTIVSFRIGQNDVESIGQYFQPTFDGDDLLRVPNYNTIVRTLIGGVPTSPFSMATLPALGTPNAKLFDALKQLSAAKYGRPKAVVEAEINQRMKTLAPPAGAGGGLPSTTRQGAAGAPVAPGSARTPVSGSAARPAAPAAPGTFLDEWLNKKNTPGAAQPAGAPAAPAAAPAYQQPAQPTPQPVMQQPTVAGQPAIQKHQSGYAAQPVAGAQPQPVVQPVAPQVQSQQNSPNISSTEVAEGEVKQIANEIKKEMDAPKADKKSEDKKPTKPKAKKEVHFDLTPGQDDTIFIDQEGELHLTNEDKKPS